MYGTLHWERLITHARKSEASLESSTCVCRTPALFVDLSRTTRIWLHSENSLLYSVLLVITMSSHTHYTHTHTLQGHKEVYWRIRIYLDPSKLQGDSFSPDSIKAIWHLVDPCFKKLIYNLDITQYHRMSTAPILNLYIKLLKVTWPLENHIEWIFFTVMGKKDNRYIAKKIFTYM